MFEKGVRGGLTQAVRRYAVANNKCMPNYKANIVSSYLEYLDASNLYGWAMRKKLPINGYKWAKNLNQYTEEFIKNYDENSDLGYLLEVDVEYPKHLHRDHEDLPFLPEKKEKFCSDKEYMTNNPNLKQATDNQLDGRTKLRGTLEDKEKYVAHISALKQALNHGLKF